MKTKLLAIAILATTSSALTIAKPGAGGHGGARGDRPNPDEIVVELIADHAGDDNELNQTELANGLIAMHEKRVAQMEAAREERSSSARRPEGRSPGGDRERPEPTEMASRLIADFDANDSGTLDSAELLEAIDRMGPKPRGGKKGPRGRRGPPPSDADSVE